MKDEKFLTLGILVLVIIFSLSACQKSVIENSNTLSTPQLLPSPTTTSDLDSPIRKIDFENFTYPWTKDLTLDTKTFTLKDGELPFEREEQIGVSLAKIEYSDLTNDGEEEAIVVTSIQTGGSSVPHIVYIYTLKDDEPKLLWSFDTGDRAEGGLKEIYAKNGEFIVELFGDNKFVESTKAFEFPNEVELTNGLCCPTMFTKFHFKWNSQTFVTGGKPELIGYDWKKRTDK